MTESPSQASTPPELLDLPLGDEAAEPRTGAVADAASPDDGARGEDEITAELPRLVIEAPPRRRWPWLLLLLLVPLAAFGGFFLRPTPPVIGVSQPLIDFADVRLGEEVSAMVSVHNRGEAELTLERVDVRGDAPGEFTILADTCFGAVLASQVGCTLEVVFRPVDVGRRQAVVEVAGDAVNGPFALPVVGSGIAPDVRIEPTTVRFAGQPIGSAGTPSRLVLRNGGSASLAVSRLALEGLAAADFVLRADACSGRTLAPNDSCAAEVYFLPTAEGTRRATVWVRSDAPGDLPSVALTGEGLTPTALLSVDVDRVDLGISAVGGTVADGLITVTNDGSGPLVIHRAEIVATAADTAVGFGAEAEACTEAPLAPGEGCEIGVRFEPPRQGPAEALLAIWHDSADEPHEVPVRAVGVAPGVKVDPLRLDLGEVPVGGRSAARPLTLRNTGLAPLAIRDARLAGNDRRYFQVSEDGCSGRSLPPDAVCTFSLRFSPLRGGSQSAELVVRHNASGGAERVSVTGFGLVARLQVDPEALSFGPVQVGEARTMPLRLENRSRARLRVAALRLGGPDARAFQIERPRCDQKTLSPGTSCTARIRFVPQLEGTRRAIVRVEHDGEGGSVEVELTAVGTPPPRPEIALSPTSFRFGTHDVGTRTDIETLTVTNQGEAALELLDIQIAGEHPADFRAVTGSCTVGGRVAPGRSCTVGVRFTAGAEGARRARLLIRHNAGGTEVVALSGSGVVPVGPG